MHHGVITACDTNKAVVSEIYDNGMHFLGFVKSCVHMSEEQKEIATNFLELLYTFWKENYNSVSKIIDITEFRKWTFKPLKEYADDLVSKNVIDPKKIPMSITAICCFKNTNTTFWINTGRDMVYVDKVGKRIKSLCSTIKELATYQEESLFSIDKDFAKKAEGRTESRSKYFYIVSYECSRYFEKCIRENIVVSEEMLKQYAQGKKGPMIIGKLRGTK